MNQLNEIFEKVKARVEQERAEFEPPPEPEPQRFSSKDLEEALNNHQDGDAWLFIQLCQDRFRFDHAEGRWYEWRGNFWAEDCVEEPLAALDGVVELYMNEARRWAWIKINALSQGDEKEKTRAEAKEAECTKRAGRLQHIRYKKDILALAVAGWDSLGITGTEWDRDPWLLPAANGVIDLKTGHFRPGLQLDYIKTICPTEWKSMDEPAPLFETFLKDIFNGDPSLIEYMQRLLGYGITGLTTEHILPIFWGQGRNGKGSLLETLAHVLGPLAGPIQAEMLLEQGRLRSSAAPTSDIMSLRGRRLAWASETDQGRRFNAGRIKWLVGGDTLVGRAPYARREVAFIPTHTLLLLTNHRPKADPTDYALWQRIHLVPFALSFVDEPKTSHERKRDPRLMDKLKTEGSGILAWLVRGCIRWQRDGLKPPDAVKQATAQYRENEDMIGQFIDECCVTGPHCFVQAGKLRKAYEEWCEENGYKAIWGNQFSEYLLGSFDRNDSRKCRQYIGIGLKADE